MAYTELTKKEDSRVTRRDGRVLCGDILGVDAEQIVVRLKGTGRLVLVPLTQVRSIRDKASDQRR